MLETIGCKSLDELINKNIPKEILTNVLFLKLGIIYRK